MSKFNYSYRVVISDINYGGHMGNDRSLSLFHEARIAFLEILAYSEMNIGDELGIIMKDAHVNFHAEVFRGDELEINVELGEQKGSLFYFNYLVIRKKDDKKVLAGKTGLLAFDYTKRKVAKTPALFIERINEKYNTHE